MTLPAQLLKVRVGGDPVRAQELGRMQDNIGTLLNEVAAVPILQAVALGEVEIPASPTTVDVAHELGRAWTSWAITDIAGNATVWRPSNEDPARFLTLTASSAVTVNLLVW